MSLIIRRFISYIGKVKLSDFKNSTHRPLVDAYCHEQEARVSQHSLLLALRLFIYQINHGLFINTAQRY
ncbi:hypothetical protein HCDG_06466 [Histoplasma capsulatum H143]|uniref:Uncharacterized protein n=1 Tax=Ajellomyces capsulatus (strain H143) TaxID=544712 RepID=C6HJT5_AJECH|nr:hypothetical protein HCDG_06466 [Histoplasma capsulatum H143]